MPSWNELKQALENPRYKWRTIRGTAKEIGASPEEVHKLITENSNAIIKSSIPADSGEDLFTTREHFRRMQSPLVKIASSLTSRVSSSSDSSDGD